MCCPRYPAARGRNTSMSAFYNETVANPAPRPQAFVRLSHLLAVGAGAVLILASVPRVATAAQINYGSHMGTHVTYVNVTEDTGASEPLPLFGAPTVTGNSMDFNPVGFDAASAAAASDS